jgi:hypothetical protein
MYKAMEIAQWFILRDMATDESSGITFGQYTAWRLSEMTHKRVTFC